jgi:DNA segregation ATPase FtsK/SpoIIIE-like protein
MLLLVWAFILLSMVGFDRADPPSHVVGTPNAQVMNWCGPVGAWAAYQMFKTLGLGAWVLVVLGGVGLMSLASGSRVGHATVRFIGLVMLTLAVSGFQNLLFPASGPFPDLAGGTVGVVGVAELVARFGQMGSALWLGALLLIGAVVAMDDWIAWAFGWMRRTGVPATVGVARAAGAVAAPVAGAAGTVAKGAGGGLMAFLGGLASRRAGSAAAVSGTSHDARRGRDEHDDSDLPEAEIESKDALDDEHAAALAEEADAELVDDADAEDGEPGEAITVDEDEDEELYSKDLAAAKKEAERKAKMEQRLAARNAKLAEKEAKRVKPAGGPGAAVAGGAVMPDPDLEQAGAPTPAEAAAQARASAAAPVAAASAAGASAPASAPAASPAGTSVAGEEEDDAPGAPQVFDADALRAKIAALPIVFGQKNKEVATEETLRDMQNAQDLEGYRFPGLDVLENPEENFNQVLEETVREQATALESALRQYKIDGEVVGIESGPVITLFEVRLAPGTRVAQLQTVDKDLARALKSVNIRIVPNTGGRDTVGIEVPNITKEKVRLKELMSKPEIFAKMRLPMFLGKDASGRPLIEDLAKMPHLLIAGTTGSGKSVCMNTIIMSFLYTRKPNELKLVLVDPKMVEMSQFKDIPHLLCPVVTEMGKAAAILEWATQKMDERYELLAEAGCRDIASYNELAWEDLKDRLNPRTPEEEAKIPRKLPYMVFIIDELADLMMTAKEVEGSIIRIAQKARAVGIHLILATQRPQANVVTGLIKSNMPARICFKVASGMDSRIVMDQKGGELLLGQGDMLFLTPSTTKLTRAQATLVDDKEIRRVVKFMKEIATPTFDRQLVQIRRAENGTGLANLTDEERVVQSKNNSSASLKAAQEDPLFESAVEIVLETRRGSVSLLQRRLAIGYTRSSRLIDLMGIAGIISDHKGSVARDVLVTPEEWAMMKQFAREEAAKQGIVHPNDAPQQSALFPSGDGAATPGSVPGSAAALGNPAAPARDDTDQHDADEHSADEERDNDGDDAPPAPRAAAPNAPTPGAGAVPGARWKPKAGPVPGTPGAHASEDPFEDAFHTDDPDAPARPDNKPRGKRRPQDDDEDDAF